MEPICHLLYQLEQLDMIWTNYSEIVDKCLVMLVKFGEHFAGFLLGEDVIVQLAHHLKLLADFSFKNRVRLLFVKW